MPLTQIYANPRRFGKTSAAARALSMTTDELLASMKSQQDEIKAWQDAHPGWDQPIRRPSIFRREYLCEFTLGPELVGPPSPTFEQWESNQRRNAREESRFYRHDWSAL